MMNLWTVSIQPKPKKGLVAVDLFLQDPPYNSFNPAEAEEGFSRMGLAAEKIYNDGVSIQPKPKKGLVGGVQRVCKGCAKGVSIQPKPKKGLVEKGV